MGRKSAAKPATGSTQTTWSDDEVEAADEDGADEEVAEVARNKRPTLAAQRMLRQRIEEYMERKRLGDILHERISEDFFRH